MNKRSTIGLISMGMAALMWAATAQAGPPKDPPTKCAPDAVLVGSVCMDKYEASVWRIPPTNLAGDSNAKLIKNVRKGKATAANLAAGDATQLGTASDNYAPCTDNGQTCKDDIYAVSLPGVTPSAYMTWFQANAACANSRKHLPSNAEWQMAVMGSPDPGGDDGTTDCNTTTTTAMLPEDPVNTGSRSSCVSALGAFDMVGNLDEWVAEWVPRSTACLGWGGFSNDLQCFAGADTINPNGPGVLRRGGNFGNSGSSAGPVAVNGTVGPFGADDSIGFRCAR